MWRSLVAHVLWEHGAGGSNPSTPTREWPLGQVVKTQAFHACNRGSNPLGVTIIEESWAFSSAVRAAGS